MTTATKSRAAAGSKQAPSTESSTPKSGAAPVLSVEQRETRGRVERTKIPRELHADWSPDPNRPDPVLTLQEQAAGRVEELLPIRYGRMMESPFSFFRGAAAVMAWDLSHLPRTQLDVQLCGDAHVSNFGFFGSPERQLLFDINDFDETLAGPWEWDVKRLATSAVVAGRAYGMSKDDCREIALTTARGYREQMAEFAELTTMEVWYSHVTAESMVALIKDSARRKQAKKGIEKARTKTSQQAARKMTESREGRLRIIENPPLVKRLPEEDIQTHIQPLFKDYKASLQEDRRRLLDRFHLVDVASRVVGVGSVGMRCHMVVLNGRDEQDVLILQVKESVPSVLAPFLPPTPWGNHGQRVVEGQRLIQGLSDLFLGWVRTAHGRDHYWRQLRDMKASADIATMSPTLLGQYGHMCGRLLARAHARSGDAIQISAYLGGGDRFDRALYNFAQLYADQNERDYQALVDAVRQGKIAAETGI